MDHEVIGLGKKERPIELDPLRIKQGYLHYPISIRDIVEARELTFAECLSLSQPKLAKRLSSLNIQLDVSYIMVPTETIKVEGLRPALDEMDLYYGHSYSVSEIDFYINGGPNMANLFVGVCWKSENPRVIVAEKNRIIPPPWFKFWK